MTGVYNIECCVHACNANPSPNYECLMTSSDFFIVPSVQKSSDYEVEGILYLPYIHANIIIISSYISEHQQYVLMNISGAWT